MTKVYLSGKISGLEKEVYEKQFYDAERFYKGCGFEVVNPCRISDAILHNNPKATYEDFMQADLKALADCTHIAMLEGWEASNGAKREKAEAERLGLEIMHLKLFGKKR